MMVRRRVSERLAEDYWKKLSQQVKKEERAARKWHMPSRDGRKGL